MAEKSNVIRIPFNIYPDNPEHQRVYAILEKQKNKNAFIRDAVLSYYAQGAGSQISREDIRQIAREIGGEIVDMLLVRMEDKKLKFKAEPEHGMADHKEITEDKKPIDFERLKNLF